MDETQRFLKRLRNELNIDVPPDAYVKRTYAGHLQRSAGAWTAFFKSKTNPFFEIGLWCPIRDLLKCPNLEAYNLHGLVVDCGCKGRCEGLKKKNFINK